MNDDERLKRDEAVVSRDFWRKLGGYAAQIPFAEELLTAYYCAFDRNTPTHVRVALIGALLYFISPLDLIPDVLPIVGMTEWLRARSNSSGIRSSPSTATPRARRWCG